jgi:hypothetical protein
MNNKIEASYPILENILIDILGNAFEDAFLNIELSDDLGGLNYSIAIMPIKFIT